MLTKAMVLPQLSYAEEDETWNPQSILDQLARVCDNPNKLNEAKDRLHAVKQGDDSLSTYIAKFERLLFEARGHNWDNDRKISAFRYGLNSTIKNRLAQQLELPDIYAEFLITVQKLSSRSGTSSFTPSSGPSNAHQYSNSHSRQLSTQRQGGDPMDISHMGGGINALDFYEIDGDGQPTGIRLPDPVRILEQRQEAAERHGLDLNQIEYEPPTTITKHIAKRPASRQTNSQQSYRESGACLRCGSFDHWLSTCPEPAPPSTNSRSAGTSGKRVTIASWNDDELYSD
jgi:Retrotransposon gag protein